MLNINCTAFQELSGTPNPFAQIISNLTPFFFNLIFFGERNPGSILLKMGEIQPTGVGPQHCKWLLRPE